MTTEANGSKKRPSFIVSIDVKTCYDRLIKANVGDMVTYEEIEQMIGRSVREKGAWILASARRRAFTQNSILFGVVTKIGVKRLNDQEIVDTANDSISRIHRLSLRAARKLTVVKDFDSLSTEYKNRHNTHASALALLNHLTKEAQLKKLEAKVVTATRSLPLQKRWRLSGNRRSTIC